MRKILLTSACIAALAATVPAQFQLTTLPQPWASNNGGGVGGGVYFDVTLSAGIVINQLDCNFSTAAGTVGTIDLYTIANTYVGNEGNQAAWTLVGSAPCTAAGRDLPTACVFGSPVVLNPGTYGFAICANSQSHAYTNGTGANQAYSDPFISLSLGAAENVCFAGTPFTPRVWNGTIHYNPASGLFPAFTADVTSGNSPLTVNFTDQSYSSDPAGVLAWIWDVDGDGNPDYSTQNVTHTYTSCGVYDVELQVLDGMHGLVALRKTAYIDVDPVTADFTYSSLGNNQVQFTDTSTGGVNGWMWDFDGDGTIDSTVQNPVHTYPQGGFYNASLTATNGCNSGTATQSVPTFGLLCTTFAGGNGLTAAGSGNLFDVIVTNPNGLLVTGLDVHGWTAGTGTVDVHYVPNTYVGNESNAAAWTLIASVGGVTFAGQPGTGDFADVPDFFLPPGSHGLRVSTSAGVAYTNGVNTAPASNLFSNGDLTIACGGGQGVLGGFVNNPRTWNGCIYYDTNPQGVYYKYADGCAGTAGVATLTASGGSAPKIGTTLTVDVGNMPVSNVAIMIFGINNQTWNGAPLPVNLRPFGAPGCFGHLAPESTSLVIGAGGTGQWNLPIPNVAGFVGTPFYNQALVIDPGVNGLGAVISDAAAGVVGQ